MMHWTHLAFIFIYPIVQMSNGILFGIRGKGLGKELGESYVGT